MRFKTLEKPSRDVNKFYCVHTMYIQKRQKEGYVRKRLKRFSSDVFQCVCNTHKREEVQCKKFKFRNKPYNTQRLSSCLHQFDAELTSGRSERRLNSERSGHHGCT